MKIKLNVIKLKVLKALQVSNDYFLNSKERRFLFVSFSIRQLEKSQTARS
jgi:hypothetical protein